MRKKILATALLLSLIMTACASGTQSAQSSGDAQETQTEQAAQGASAEHAMEEEPEDVKYVLTYEEAVKYVSVPKDLSTVSVQITKADPISEDDVNTEIDYYREYIASIDEVTDRDTVETGDVIVINYTCTVDGQDIEDKSGAEIEIGAGYTLDGFEESLIGMKKNESKDITCKFPDDFYEEELAGKEAVFSVTIVSINQKTVPELTDEKVKELEKKDINGKQITTVNEFRSFVKQYLELQRTQETVYNNRESAISAVINASEIKQAYPEEMVNSFKKEAYGDDTEDDGDIYDEYIQRTITEKCIVLILAKENGISPTEDELTAFIKEIFGDEMENYISSMTDTEKDFYRDELLKNKVADLVLSKANKETVTEAVY